MSAIPARGLIASARHSIRCVTVTPSSPTSQPLAGPELTTAAHEAARTFGEPDEALAAAVGRSEELGVVPVAAETGTTLSSLTAALGANAIVEVGTGTGVSALWMLRGMTETGTLTSIDVEPQHHAAARAALHAAGVTPARTRLIIGRGLDVLPRLTDGGYDMVFIDATRSEYPLYLQRALPLLRRGGLLALHGVLTPGALEEPGRRDAESLALRELLRDSREDPRLVCSLLPLGVLDVRGGLLVAALANPEARPAARSGA